MSALGQKQTCAAHKLMSALHPKATSNATYGDVRFGPKADICDAYFLSELDGQGEVKHRSCDKNDEGRRHAYHAAIASLWIASDAIGVNSSAYDKNQTQCVDCPFGAGLCLGERHEQERQWNIFGEISVHADATHQGRIAAVTQSYACQTAKTDNAKA